ncbi:MAG: hypothetical protein IT372_08990, partial [Polyangiaceae bacterium]|nr:hypothetical protein [Polyangiaceae bacterium]
MCAAALWIASAACGDGEAGPGGQGGAGSGAGGQGGTSAAGGGGGGGGGSGTGGAGGSALCSSPPCDELATAAGCAGPFNPDQVLDLRLTLSAGDWSALKADTTYSVYFPADFQCNDDPPLPFQVGIRRKRSGGIDKPGLKIDFNHIAPDQDWQTLRKLSLENGVSEGSATVEMVDLVAEYLAWRGMVRSGALSGRAAFTRVYVNGELLG